MYDVIIAGAGPSGATAAYFLGVAGHRVLVLEKETLPRYKPCGGGLSIRFLEEQFPFSFDPVIERRVESIRYTLDGRSVTVPVHDRMMGMVMRDQFDAHILAHARAEVWQGTAARAVTETPDRIIVETRDGRIVEGRYLIGADGANSVVARSVGLRRGKTMAAAVEAEVPVRPEVMRRFADGPVIVFGDVRLGYLWVFPKRDHLSVGIALAQLFYKHPRGCFMLGVRNPFATRAFIDLLSDRADYPKVILRLLGSLPVYLIAEGVAALAGLLGGPERRRQLRRVIYSGVSD